MLLENKMRSLMHYIKRDKRYLIAAATLTATGFLDAYVTQNNLKEISHEGNPIGRLLLEHWGISGLYYTKAAITASAIGVTKLTGLSKYGEPFLYMGSAIWGYMAATWYVPQISIFR